MKRIVLLASLLLAALPLLAHEERKVILVLVDTVANRAYIPEGTVLPPHVDFNIRMEKFRLYDAEVAQLRAGRDGGKGNARTVRSGKGAIARLKAKPPLALHYAPAEQFVEVRKGYEAQAAKRRSRVQAESSHQNCYDIYVQDDNSGMQGWYYNGFTSTFCSQSSGTQVGYP